MAYEALLPYTDRSRTFRFVSNVDGADIAEALRDLDPAETLFVVSSKTFTTIETLTNARTARAWLLDALGDEGGRARAVAVSTNAEKVASFGIDPANMFGFWDWVGSRYSYPSAIGLSLMVAIGPTTLPSCWPAFTAWTSTSAPPRSSATCPCCWGCSGLVHRLLRGRDPGRAPLQYLGRFPAYLQQLDMESNGVKSVPSTGRRSGGHRPGGLGPASTNGQHAFYQPIHQGTRLQSRATSSASAGPPRSSATTMIC